MSKTCVFVSAAANIALVKYWGKKPGYGNQPATGSLSVGLEDLRTQTTLAVGEGDSDLIEFDASAATRQRLTSYFDQVRQEFDSSQRFVLKTENNFPTGTGLASSASGFAALALAVNELLELHLSDSELSRLAMRGSGSAARSVFGGFVEVIANEDAYARLVMPAEYWPLSIIVAITDESPKATGSTEAMLRTASTSPYYQSWLDTHGDDMQAARDALLDRDFEKLAEVAEASCLKMHASVMTSQPSIMYWQPATVEIMQCVRFIRQRGIACFFTIDAGSQVKIICEPDHLETVSATVGALAGVQRLIKTEVGGTPIIS